jgi:hypothetical protein
VSILQRLQVIQVKSVLFYAAPDLGDLRVEKNHVLREYTVCNLYRPLKPLQIKHNSDTIRVVCSELNSWAECDKVFGHNSFGQARNRQTLLSSAVV